ncbi:extracellular catalytic domain type 1 short-chain-length polyhydroxyalkanoate depolymerase [Streptomyces sp. NBC_01808]|uniref:extracellular catalytic domain type 1 short-chain-length polyhydroxyalkanoate depolymerase n=1 Tax=Streptomyces sp. NBC_01808 TaxID=2975947 RepID=UPI002DD7ACAD|nr:PHB depolymerase family esterase [Streptomyces sp. NBC_01808]
MQAHGMPPETKRRARHAIDRRFGLFGLLAIAAALAAVATLVSPSSHASAAVSLEKVSNFGSNPGALNMYVYKPSSAPEKAPVVVALHGCTQDAQGYADHSGLPEMADKHGFIVVFGEQTSSNNLNKCFNWFQSADIKHGQGEAASIAQMVEHAGSAYGADTGKAYVTGLSAGGAMTSVMLAAYPDVFKAGAVVAGLPYDCSTGSSPYTCMSPGVDKTPDEWAQRVHDGYPGYSGTYPRIAIWHGDNDTTVVPKNADELRDQWTAVHGLGQTPDKTGSIGPNGTKQEQYLAGDGSVAVEVDKVPGINHGTPVDPGSGEQQCGQAGAYFLDSICSSHFITDFFGLQGS